MNDKRTVLGLILVALSLGAGILAYYLYGASKPGRPDFRRDPNNKSNEVNLYLPEGVTGGWKWDIYHADKGDEVEIRIDIEPSFQAAPGAFLLEFIGNASASNVSAVQQRQGEIPATSDHVIQYSWLDGEPDGDPRTFVMIEPILSESEKYDIIVRATLRSPLVARENERVTIATPFIGTPQICSGDLKKIFQEEIVEGPFHRANILCDSVKSEGRATAVIQIWDLPLELRVDYEMPVPYARERIIWYLTEDQHSIGASYVIVSAEAKGQRFLFLSGIAAGLGAATLPLGIEFVAFGLRRRDHPGAGEEQV